MEYLMTSCIRCDKEVRDLPYDNPRLHPVDGLCFQTYGHYGSGYFDPMDGTVLQLVVCDECVKGLEGEGRAIRLRSWQAPVQWMLVKRGEDDDSLA